MKTYLFIFGIFVALVAVGATNAQDVPRSALQATATPCPEGRPCDATPVATPTPIPTSTPSPQTECDGDDCDDQVAIVSGGCANLMSLDWQPRVSPQNATYHYDEDNQIVTVIESDSATWGFQVPITDTGLAVNPPPGGGALLPVDYSYTFYVGIQTMDSPTDTLHIGIKTLSPAQDLQVAEFDNYGTYSTHRDTDQFTHIYIGGTNTDDETTFFTIDSLYVCERFHTVPVTGGSGTVSCTNCTTSLSDQPYRYPIALPSGGEGVVTMEATAGEVLTTGGTLGIAGILLFTALQSMAHRGSVR